MPHTILEWLAIGIGHRETRDGHRLPSQGIPTVLDVDKPPSGRTILGVDGSSDSFIGYTQCFQIVDIVCARAAPEA